MSFLAENRGITPGEMTPHMYTHTQEDVARHLFAVASGIDSMILGETEILGQVREALTEASRAEAIGLPLSRLFHWALRTGRMAGGSAPPLAATPCPLAMLPSRWPARCSAA